MVWVQTDETGLTERGDACKPAKFPGLVHKAVMQGVALVCNKIGMGLKGGGDGVMECEVLLCGSWSWSCSFPLQP